MEYKRFSSTQSSKKRTSGAAAFATKFRDLHIQRDANSLTDWLNEPKRDLQPHQQKAAHAIELLRLLGAIPIKERRHGESGSKELREELEQLIEPLQHLRWRILHQGDQPYLDQSYRDDSNYGLYLIARLSAFGLDWVRRCPCGRWFVTYSRRNEFHSDECRLKFWKDALKTPEGRERHRLYMRRQRALKKRLKSKRKEKR